MILLLNVNYFSIQVTTRKKFLSDRKPSILHDEKEALEETVKAKTEEVQEIRAELDKTSDLLFNAKVDVNELLIKLKDLESENIRLQASNESLELKVQEHIESKGIHSIHSSFRRRKFKMMIWPYLSP